MQADIVEVASAQISLTRDAVGTDGTTTDPALFEQIGETLRTLAGHLRSR